MQDGDKIIVFGGSFTTTDNSTGKSFTCLRLMFNGVRKAHMNAKLGYLSPSYLLRGISIKSIRSGKNMFLCLKTFLFTVLY